jgi:hypothetical protein
LGCDLAHVGGVVLNDEPANSETKHDPEERHEGLQRETGVYLIMNKND